MAQDRILVRGYLADSISLQEVNNVLISAYINGNLILKKKCENNGTFNLSLSSTIETVLIKFSHIGYVNREISVNLGKKEIDLGRLGLLQKTINLKEVNIVSRAGITLTNNKDTLEADFSRHKFERYTMTDKALEIISGLKVIDSKVFYNGEEISDVKVEGRAFLFDNRFLMQNLPGFTIGKVQIVHQTDKLGRKQRQLNIVLKDSQKKAYLFDVNLSKGTSSSEWSTLTSGYISAKYQGGLRMQSNNINQLSDGWDISSIVKSNNLQGLYKIQNLEFSGFYKINKSASLDLRYLNNNHLANSEQNNSILDILSETQAFLTNNSRNKNRNQNANFIFRNRLDSLTTFSIRSNTVILNKATENTSIYITQNAEAIDTVKFKSLMQFKGINQSFIANFDKLRKVSKSNFYNFEIKTEINRGENDDYSFDDSGDSLLNRNTKAYLLALEYRMNFDINKYSSIQLYTNNELNLFSSSDLDETGHLVKIKGMQDKSGLKYTMNRKSTTFSVDLSSWIYNLNINRNSSYNILGLISNVNWDYSLKNGHKIGLYFNSNYNLPSIMQLTGIASSGQQQVLNVQPNTDLRPEGKFNLNFKYIFKKYLKTDADFSYTSNKIENILLTPVGKAPLLKYVNSGGVKGLSLNIAMDKTLLKDKIKLFSSLGVRFNEANYSLNNLFFPYDMMQLFYNFSFVYEATKKIELKYFTQINKMSYLNSVYPNDIVFNNNLTFKWTCKDFFILCMEGKTINYHNEINHNNNFTNLNIVFSKYVFKNRNPSVFIKGNNLFNNVLQQTVSSNADRLQYSVSNNIGRYYLFGVNYKFSTFK